MTQSSKKIVCIGGGTGLSTLLRGLKKYYQPTAIVTMADSGGHSGRLRDELGMLPPGDVRSCLVALVDDSQETLLRDLFNYRFDNGSYSGASVGNLLLAALSDILGNFNDAVGAAHALLGLRGKVAPVTLESTDLLAELEDGTILFGEKAIDVPRQNGHMKIKRVWLQPLVQANPEAVKSILEADTIIFGPGDLYTSLIANLCVKGIPEALNKSKAQLLYITNIMTKHGETDEFQVADFVRALESHLPRPIQHVLYNTKKVPVRLLRHYETEKAIAVQAPAPEAHWLGYNVLSVAGDLARHDSDTLAVAVRDIIENK